MNKRWYDAEPTLSMAISLLHNAQKRHRDEVVHYMQNGILALCPNAFEQVEGLKQGFWSFLQKRKTLDIDAWMTIEAMRFLPEEPRHQLAVEVIRYIYCLEHEETFDAEVAAEMSSLEAVL